MTNKIILSASSLDGETVNNAQGEELGSVKEIMLDTQTNEIAYYVLSFGGVFGVGDKLFAIPPQAMQLDCENKCFILDASKEQLDNAEGFDKDNWPNMADTTFRTNLYNHYGIKQQRRAA